MAPVGEADLFDDCRSAGVAFAFGYTLVEQAEFDVVDHGAVAEEVERLEHETDPVRSHGGAFLVRQAGDVDTVEQIVTFGRRVEETE